MVLRYFRLIAFIAFERLVTIISRRNARR